MALSIEANAALAEIAGYHLHIRGNIGWPARSFTGVMLSRLIFPGVLTRAGAVQEPKPIL